MTEPAADVVPQKAGECRSSIQYHPGPEFICALPAGHKGPHQADTPVTPVIWTAAFAVPSPRRL